MEKQERPDREKIIYVNRKEILVKEDVLTGKQILEYAELNVVGYDLFLVRGQDSKQIPANKPCEIKNGIQFHAILKSVPYG